MCSLVLATEFLARRAAVNELRARSQSKLSLVVANLRAELGKYRQLPSLISSEPAYLKAIVGTDPNDPRRANHALQRTAYLTGLSALFLARRDGTIIATSDWDNDANNVGENISGESFFQEALQSRLGRDFAVDAVRRQRHYYFTYAVQRGEAVVGVLVAKLGLDNLEAEWLGSGANVLVTDRAGVAFLSSIDTWRLAQLSRTSQPAIPSPDILRRYGPGTRPVLRLRPRLPASGRFKRIQIAEVGRRNSEPAKDYFAYSMTMADTGWTISLLTNPSPVDNQVQTALLILSAALAILLLGAAVLYQRQNLLSERIRLEARSRRELEERVEQRTVELETAQASLVQASKLAALGELSAGLSHELNQPLAAIRAYTGNAETFLKRGDHHKASGNLANITELTGRMARIIQNLKTYAREETVEARPTHLLATIRGALELMQRPLKEASVEVQTDFPDQDPRVIGGNVRLQQVFVNLLSNGLDAVRDRQPGRIKISVREVDARRIDVIVEDNGAGVDPDHIANVFDPFFSTKEVGEGVGLGLSIAYGIIKQFGGDIQVCNGEQGGAEFTVSLARAETEAGA